MCSQVKCFNVSELLTLYMNDVWLADRFILPIGELQQIYMYKFILSQYTFVCVCEYVIYCQCDWFCPIVGCIERVRVSSMRRYIH